MKRLLVPLIAAAMLAACTPVQTTAPGAVGVERRQYMGVSEEQINEAAGLAYSQELKEAAQRGALNTNPEHVNRVRNIASRLISQTGVFRPDARNWRWEVNVENNPQMNAYAMPGGKVMVYSGLIDKLRLSDDELASVMAHEIAHALREHGRERVSRQVGQQTAVVLGAALLGVQSEGLVNLANQVATVTFGLPHDRRQELEADGVGLELMARAGYNPQAAISVWQKMLTAGGSRPPEFLSTHPSGETRIADLQRLMPRVMPLYQASRR